MKHFLFALLLVLALALTACGAVSSTTSAAIATAVVSRPADAA
ncbi:MAG TPA: hypothetical protein VII93_08915 [Anaerolineales bacterium]